MLQHTFIDILLRHKSTKVQSIWIRNNSCMHYLIQQPSRIKYEKIAHLYPPRYILSIYMFYIFLGDYILQNYSRYQVQIFSIS